MVGRCAQRMFNFLGNRQPVFQVAAPFAFQILISTQ